MHNGKTEHFPVDCNGSSRQMESYGQATYTYSRLRGMLCEGEEDGDERKNRTEEEETAKSLANNICHNNSYLPSLYQV